MLATALSCAALCVGAPAAATASGPRTPTEGGPPTATGALVGLSSGAPSLGLTVKWSTPLIKSCSISLHDGLSFNPKAINARLLKHGRLTERFKGGVTDFSIVIRSPQLRASKRLSTPTSAHTVKWLRISLWVTSAKGKTIALTLKLRPRHGGLWSS
jgi:hypothetical protein